MSTKPYWIEWFKGLTHKFLNLRIPKQLLLAGNDRMDKELMIAHMEGRFKMVVVDEVGHAVHEDRPSKVAEIFRDFLNKFHIPTEHNKKMVITSISGK
jgi:protein phosphatase methylesterase 1